MGGGRVGDKLDLRDWGGRVNKFTSKEWGVYSSRQFRFEESGGGASMRQTRFKALGQGWG